MTEYDYKYFTTNRGRYNNQQWHIYERHEGRTAVFVNAEGAVTSVLSDFARRRFLKGGEAVKFVNSSAWADDFRRWNEARTRAISRWKGETPNKEYTCDGGTIALRLNGSAIVFVANRSGDGMHRVWRVARMVDAPTCFKDTGVFIGEGTRVEVLPHDCVPYTLGDGPLVPLYDFVAKSFVTLGVFGGDFVLAGGEGEAVMK